MSEAQTELVQEPADEETESSSSSGSQLCKKDIKQDRSEHVLSRLRKLIEDAWEVHSINAWSNALGDPWANARVNPLANAWVDPWSNRWADSWSSARVNDLDTSDVKAFVDRFLHEASKIQYSLPIELSWSHDKVSALWKTETSSSAVPGNIPVANKPVLRSVPLNELRELEGLYEFRGGKAVSRFLTEHQDVLSLLKKIPEIAENYFQSIEKMVIDLRADPKGASHPQLFVYIVTNHDAEEAWKRLREIEDEWWFEAVGEAMVNLHVEFA